jgi:hypothetical protein
MPNIRIVLFLTLIFALASYFYNGPHAVKNTMSLSSKLSITDIKLEGERVLIRVDFNVP